MAISAVSSNESLLAVVSKLGWVAISMVSSKESLLAEAKFGWVAISSSVEKSNLAYVDNELKKFLGTEVLCVYWIVDYYFLQ